MACGGMEFLVEDIPRFLWLVAIGCRVLYVGGMEHGAWFNGVMIMIF